MTETKRSCSMATAVALVLVFGLASAEAQLPKRGDYSGVFGFHWTGETHPVTKDHVMFSGHSSGTFFNDEKEGFLHAASVTCPSVDNVPPKDATAQGCAW
jgi:hypothetical protein